MDREVLKLPRMCPSATIQGSISNSLVLTLHCSNFNGLSVVVSSRACHCRDAQVGLRSGTEFPSSFVEMTTGRDA